MHLILKFLKLPFPDKYLLIKTSLYLLIVKAMVVFLPLRWYKKLLGKPHKHELANNVTDLAKHHIYRVSKAIVRSRKIYGWNNQCLTEAITAKILLKHYGLISSLHLGIKKEEGSLKAHAWLCYGELFVTGRKAMPGFKEISSFT